MDAAYLGGLQALAQLFLAVLVHEEADGAAVHAVDRDGIVHEAVQGLQHQAVTTERDDGVGIARLDVAVAMREALQRRLRFCDIAGDERDLVERLAVKWHFL